MFASRKFAAFADMAAVAAAAIALGLTQAPARAATSSSSAPDLSGFSCTPPPGINLPSTTVSYESSQGGHIRIQCYWTYKAGKVPVGGLAGFPCHFGGTPLPNSTAYFGKTSGGMGCSS
jgi:hypothetical protein